MIFFDQDLHFHALDSHLIREFEVDLGKGFQQAVADVDSARTEVVTDGNGYYVLSESELNSPGQTIDEKELELLQQYFFSEEAMEVALEVDPSALESQDKGSLIYGTTGAKSIYEALRRVAAGKADTFLDIGCGCGLPVLIASHLVGTARGIELVPSMVEFAARAAKKFECHNTEFVAANIRDAEIGDVDIVYVAATTLTEELRRVIGDKLEQLRPGAIVITLTYSFQSEHLVLVDKFKSPFAWWRSSEPSEHDFMIHIRRAS